MISNSSVTGVPNSLHDLWPGTLACALHPRTGLARLAASDLGGVQWLQISSRLNPTTRTSVRRRRHLYRTFSRTRNIRLARSTWLLVRTRRLTGPFRYAISLGNLS